MLCILNSNHNPYFNLALEEYLLKEFSEEYFMLWRNSPCIVVGRNQNTLAEINQEYALARRIPVVRRLSGGGAVFHDLGNLNFTFIVNDTENSFCNFRRFAAPIIEVLRSLGLPAELSGRNDLTIDGRKFSGNAQLKYQNRLLHHGTILFSAAIADITAALRVDPAKFDGKAVKSVNSRVTNIQSHLSQPLTIEELESLILNHVIAGSPEHTLYRLNPSDIQKINVLSAAKYSAWEWNYGRSPAYTLRNQARFAGGSVETLINVKDGIIQNIRIYGDFFGAAEIGAIEQALIGVKHEKQAVRAVLSRFQIQDYLANISAAELMTLLF